MGCGSSPPMTVSYPSQKLPKINPTTTETLPSVLAHRVAP